MYGDFKRRIHTAVSALAFLIAALAIAGKSGQASAAMVPILNPSFELDTVPSPPGYSYYPDGWNSSSAGVYDFNDDAANSRTLPTPTDGHQIAWLNQLFLYQILSTDLVPDMQYTLQADFSAATLPTGYTFGLYTYDGVTTTLLAEKSEPAPTPFAWDTTTVTYVSPSVVAPGQALMVYITDPSNNPQLLVDNVRLDATAPEPASASILLVSGLALLGLRRR